VFKMSVCGGDRLMDLAKRKARHAFIIHNLPS